jgi:hypothetical protein
LRAGIVREKSCASVLVIPQRKMSLCETLHGRAAMAGVGASMGAMGSSPEMKGKGRGGGGQGVQVWGAMGRGRAAGGAMGRACGLLVAISSCFVHAEHEEKTIGRKEKKRRRKERRKRKGRKRKERKRKEKNWKI